MTRDDIVTQVNQVLEEGFEIEPNFLEPDALLREDLELDSLDAVDLVVALEKEFGVHFSEKDAKNIRLLSDVYDAIENIILAPSGEGHSA